MRDFCSPSFNFLCACANRKGQRWTGREGSYVFHFVNQLPVRHPEEVCHANASVAQIFLRKRHTLTRTSWLRKTEWVSIKTSTHKSTTKLRNFPSAVTNGGFQLILYTSSQLTAQNARHMVVLLFGVFFFYNDVVGEEVVSCLLCVCVVVTGAIPAVATRVPQKARNSLSWLVQRELQSRWALSEAGFVRKV